MKQFALCFLRIAFTASLLMAHFFSHIQILILILIQASTLGLCVQEWWVARCPGTVSMETLSIQLAGLQPYPLYANLHPPSSILHFSPFMLHSISYIKYPVGDLKD